jgi:hypothetical protein
MIKIVVEFDKRSIGTQGASHDKNIRQDVIYSEKTITLTEIVREIHRVHGGIVYDIQVIS